MQTEWQDQVYTPTNTHTQQRHAHTSWLVCVCVSKKGRSSRSVTLQHCQFTSSTITSISALFSVSLPLKINLSHMHVCVRTLHTVLYIKDTSILLCAAACGCGGFYTFQQVSAHAHTDTHLSSLSLFKSACQVCGQGDFSHTSHIEIATMACHGNVITDAHTYSLGINMYCSARRTSFLSTNSVSEDQLHRWCQAFYAHLNNRDQ